MENTMGGRCSRLRSRHSQKNRNRDNGHFFLEVRGSDATRPTRHCVGIEVPDDSISKFYPSHDNYLIEDDGTRSPKTLAELCTDSLCRALPYLDGELPLGLPQDVVDDIVGSLVKHNALNATTLKVLRNCEISSLRLAGCRGVTDSWLEPLSTNTSTSLHDYGQDSPETYYETMDIDEIDNQKGSEVFYDASCEHSGNDYKDEESSSSSLNPWTPANGNPSVHDRKMDFSCEEKCDAYEHINPTTSNMTLLDLRGSHRLTDRGLRQLLDLSSLEVARLDNCHSLIGRGLLVFQLSYRLHTLSLANCRRLTDEAIVNISHLNSLEALSLDGCRCLTDQSLVALSGLYLLKKLDLSQCDLITDRGLEYLEDLEVIEELNLGWCRNLSNEGLDILTQQSGRSDYLKILSLARCVITDNGVEVLRRLKNLEELDLNGCSSLGSSALGMTLSHLKKLTNLDVSYCPGILCTSWQGSIQNLKQLDLNYAGVRDNHLSRFTYLPALEELNLDSCLIGDWSISHLAENNVTPNLISLDLADTDVSDFGMVHLAKFKKLKRLSLFYCNISNAGLRHLAQLTCLEALNLDSRDIGDNGLFYLQTLTNLKSLDIFSGRITDAGCSHISKIESLESLELCGGGISDQGCEKLARLEKLTVLNLSQNDRITNRGAAALVPLSNLKALNLSNTRVNSLALIHFSHLMHLQSLAMYGCRGMEDSHEIDRLQKELPSLKCIRLNNGLDADDGVVVQEENDSHSDSEYDDDSSTDSGRPFVLRRRSSILAPYVNSDSSDDDSDMEHT